MATIKSYSDLQQSKKLANILPLESVDMYYSAGNETQPTFRLHSYGHIMSNKDVCAWSLAALLDVLHDYTLQTNTDGKVFVVCESKKTMISDAYDNPVDACVAMIIKLSELKML